jgi:tetratricopeptide (TPR) repeat protein
VSCAEGRPDTERQADPGAEALLTDVERLVAEGEIERAVECLEAGFPQRCDDPATWPLAAPLLEPARATVEQLVESGTVTPAAVRLLVRGADHLASRGDYAVAQEWLDRVGAVQRAIADDDPVHTHAARSLAELLLELDAPDRARTLLEASLARDIETRGAADRATALDRNRLSYACDRLDDLAAAQEHAERAIETLDALGPPDRDAAHARRRLGAVLAQSGEPERAVELLREALAIAEEAAGPDSIAAAETHNVFAYALATTGDLAGAEREYEQALLLYEAVAGPDHHDVGVINHALGRVLHQRRDYPRARTHLERALSICERTLPPDHTSLWDQHRLLADTLEWLGEYGLARPHREQALAWVERVKGIADTRYADALGSLGWVLCALGQTQAGLSAYRRAVDARAGAKGVDDSLLASFHRRLASVEWEHGSHMAAIESWTRAIEIDARAGDSAWVGRLDQLHLANALHHLGAEEARAYEALGRATVAERLVAGASEALEQAKAVALDTDLMDDLVSSARALVQTGASTEARSALERATDALDDEEPESGIAQQRALRTAQGWSALGGALRAAGELEGALDAYVRGAQVLATWTPDDVQRSTTLVDVGTVRAQSGDDEGALDSYREAVELARAAQNGQILQSALGQLGRTLVRVGDLDAARAAFEEQVATLAELEPAPYTSYQRGSALHDIALIDAEREDFAHAAEGFRDAAECKLAGASGNPSHDYDIATTIVSLARTLIAQGRSEEQADLRDEAAGVLRDHLATFEARSDVDECAKGLMLNELSTLLWYRDARDEAIATLRQAVVSYQRAGDRDKTVGVLETLGNMLTWQRAFRDALSVYRQRLALLEASEQRRPLEEGETLDLIADMERELRELRPAIEHYREALARKRQGNASATGIGHTLLPLGRVLVADDKLGEALAAFEERLALLEALPERNAILEGVTLHDIADVRRRQGDLAAAVVCFRRAVMQKRAGGAEERRPGDLAVTLEALARTLRESDQAEEAEVLEAEAAALRARAEDSGD